MTLASTILPASVAITRQQPACAACALATPLPAAHSGPAQCRSVQTRATAPSRRDTASGMHSQEFPARSLPPPPVPPPPPPPIFEDDSSIRQEQDSKGMNLAGIGLACLTALGFLYGFQEDNTDALRESRNLPPRTISFAAADSAQQEEKLFATDTFPTTLVSGQLPVGMQPQWAHQWRYDANGQPYVKLQGRWWRLQRPPGSHSLVTFFDVQNQFRPGLEYVYTAPNDWPLDEIDLCDQRTMALLFGQDTHLEDHLQPLE